MPGQWRSSTAKLEPLLTVDDADVRPQALRALQRIDEKHVGSLAPVSALRNDSQHDGVAARSELPRGLVTETTAGSRDECDTW